MEVYIDGPPLLFGKAVEVKTIGLIGGMSWESSALYYRLINEGVQRRLGGHHNATSLMVTVDFDDVERLQHEGKWDELGEMMAGAAVQLERGGAECVLLCTNTMHLLAESITKAVAIPMLHIVDATAVALREFNYGRVGLLGTKFTMENGFYHERMRQGFGIELVVPPPDGRAMVHEVIYEELCHGVIREESREKFVQIIDALKEAGAEAVILGCTEIELLVSQADSALPVFPSTRLHAEMAVVWALG